MKALGVPCFLGGMARGLLGRNNKIHIRQRRRDALAEADVVIMIGTVCDFRLSYGRVLNRKSKVIAVNRNHEQLMKNSDVFWKPTLAVQADPASFIVQLKSKISQSTKIDEWVELLKGREIEKEKTNKLKAEATPEKLDLLFLTNLSYCIHVSCNAFWIKLSKYFFW